MKVYFLYLTIHLNEVNFKYRKQPLLPGCSLATSSAWGPYALSDRC